ncbi:MAG TPA: PfkB family carbohydrate kinase [Actinomycetota bacterium]|nr:PfkB family carbohydrate kinase [Actinomycetota bacterium]
MSLVVVGSVAFDSVATPFGERERMLGGSATHFALAASFFTQVSVVGVVGDDFTDEHATVLTRRGIRIDDLEHVEGGTTFFWRGRYDFDLNTAHTLDTQLNVFADFQPRLSDASKAAGTLFLGNIQPGLQAAVRSEYANGGPDGRADPGLVGLDSMNLWIDTQRDALLDVVATVDALLLNDAEVRALTREPNTVRAARRLRDLGPRFVVVKRGEYGAALFGEDGFVGMPGYPLETVVDPTGAGDSFAGGFFGYLAGHGGGDLAEGVLRRAMAVGSVMASFNVEGFGTERVQALTESDIRQRFDDFKSMMSVESLHLASALRTDL